MYSSVDKHERKTVDQDHPEIEKVSSARSYLGYVSLLMFTVQKVLRATLIRYTRTTQRANYIGSTFVFFGEIQKTILSLLFIFCQERSIFIGLRKLAHAIVYQSNLSLKLSFIAVIYTIQNNLNIVAISKLDVPTYVVERTSNRREKWRFCLYWIRSWIN